MYFTAASYFLFSSSWFQAFLFPSLFSPLMPWPTMVLYYDDCDDDDGDGDGDDDNDLHG